MPQDTLTPWSDVAAKLPQDLPQEHYDAARQQYFKTQVAPRLAKTDSPRAAWERFDKATKRQTQAGSSIAGFTAGAMIGLTKPLKSVLPSVVKPLEEVQSKLKVQAPIASAIGETVGDFAAFGAIGAIIPELGEGKLAHAVHGIAAFSALEAASAEQGHRLTAGAKGALIGAGFEGALGLVGRLLEKGVPHADIDKIVTKALTGEGVLEDIDKTVAEEVKKSAEASRKEARPGALIEDPKTKGIQVILRDQKGAPLPVIEVHEGKEQQMVDQIKEWVDKGASVEGFKYNPQESARLQKVLRLAADQNKGSYEGFKTITVEPSRREQIIQTLKEQNIPVTKVDDSTLVVKGPTANRPSLDQINLQLSKLTDEEGGGLSKGAKLGLRNKILALWDEATPAANKEVAADQLRNWSGQLRDVIPNEFVRSIEVGEPIEERAEGSIVDRAKELGMSEAEISRLEEIEKASKESGIDVALESASEEKRRLNPELFNAEKRIPLTEKLPEDYEPTPQQLETMQPASIKGDARRYAVKITDQLMSEVFPGSAAVTAGPATAAGREYGFKTGLEQLNDKMNLDFSPLEGKELKDIPTIVYTESADRATVYHENLHVDKYHVHDGQRRMSGGDLPSGPEKTIKQISGWLKQHPAYKHYPEDHLAEEAFVHTATAFRTGDTPYLEHLARVDTSVDHLGEMVQGVAENLLTAARESIDSAQARVVQRKMTDLIRRTSPERMWEFKDGTKFIGDMFPAEEDAWRFIDAAGRQYTIEGGLKEAADFLEKQTGTDHAPSFSLWAEAKGIRGPFTPRGGSPSGPEGLPTHPDNVKWSGWTTISGLFRPFFPWVADTDTRINEALGKFGKRLPLYDRAKDVDDAFRKRMVIEEDLRDKIGPHLQGLGKKQLDVMQLLNTEPKHWGEMAKRLSLTPEHVAKATAIRDFIQNDLKAATDRNGLNYLLDEQPKLRAFGYNVERVYGDIKKTSNQMSFFERGIKEGKLDPKSQHLGSFIDFMIREGLGQKITDKSLGELDKIVKSKAKDGTYILGNMRYPLENYLRYMRGVPDVTGQVMNKTVGDFTAMLGRRAADMNKHLPEWAQLPTEFQYPGALLNKAMVWSYAAGLGLRASIPIRDTLQVLSTGMPILGPKRFALGLARGLTREGFEFAKESGALLTKHNIGELYGDVFNELPVGASEDRITKLAQKLLSPSRWGHNGARTVVFSGEYHSALDAVRGYREGRVTLDELIKDHTSLWWNDKPVRDRMLQMVHDPLTSPEEAAKQIALEITDLTLWPYRRGTQPTLLRTGAGRILGQFGMWPMNYLDFIRRGATKYTEYPGNALKATALWGAANYAAVSAMEGMGIDSGKWFFVSPAGYGLSPHAQFLLDLAKSPEETPDGREARKRVLEYPLDFMPSGIELENIYKVWDTGEPPFDSEGHPTPAFLQVMGFKPLKEDQPDRDFDEQLKYELGMEGRRP